MDLLLTTVLLLTAYAASAIADNFVPCSDLSSELSFPCKCALGPVESVLEDSPSITIDCDKVVFFNDLPVPNGAPIIFFSQRWAGLQSLPAYVNNFIPKYK